MENHAGCCLTMFGCNGCLREWYFVDSETKNHMVCRLHDVNTYTLGGVKDGPIEFFESDGGPKIQAGTHMTVDHVPYRIARIKDICVINSVPKQEPDEDGDMIYTIDVHCEVIQETFGSNEVR